jgi:GRAB domain/GRIP domain
LLKEERDRDRAKNQSVVASAETSTVQLASERDAALSEVARLEQQLAAALADLEVARSDTARVMTGNHNLQLALEAFQGERDAELAMMEEQRLAAEQAMAAAAAATLEATHEANEARIREIQRAADDATRLQLEKRKQLEGKLETFRVENVQMRRSLDEAIHRLQTTQEDVIDRVLMKNILLDWLTKKGSKEKHQVLELMASVLHFTEDDKEKVHIGMSHEAAVAHHHFGLAATVVGTVAAPLPPAKADVEHLEGDNVREKFFHFLMAETDD